MTNRDEIEGLKLVSNLISAENFEEAVHVINALLDAPDEPDILATRDELDEVRDSLNKCEQEISDIKREYKQTVDSLKRRIAKLEAK